jgi:hypothetical protein
MATDTERIPPAVTSAHRVQDPLHVMVIGAGGTGGRLIPPLMQVLKRGDVVSIIDGDHVEDRNLARQNFRTRDIGENKAEVMATRYRRDGITANAYAAMLTEPIARTIITSNGNITRTAILGCVDNWKARETMLKVMGMCPGNSVWIDGGNERRGGQVIMTARSWPFKVKDMMTGREQAGANWNLPGMKLAIPQLLEPTPWHCATCDIQNDARAETCKKCKQPEESCRDRIDLQTVAVNALSATCILNTLSCLLYQVPFSACGSFFSTLNTMSPIKLDSLNQSNYEIRPETTYAHVEK